MATVHAPTLFPGAVGGKGNSVTSTGSGAGGFGASVASAGKAARQANRTAEEMSEQMRGVNPVLTRFRLSSVRNFMVVP
jgi:hypothetical protein